MKNILFGLGLLLGPTLASAQTRPPLPAASSATTARYLAPAEQLTLRSALEMADRVRAKAAILDKQVSVAVVDASGQLVLLTRGDGVGPHNTEAARRKAYTALSTKTATLLLGRNARANPDTQNLNTLPELLLLGGGVPLWHNGQVVGGVGVSGGGGPETDDLLGRAAALPEVGITIP
ncbi:MAG: heme-binding protein [Bacteroidota bacterium]|nr:heme-binding protein [Bacteroidota bacterium]